MQNADCLAAQSVFAEPLVEVVPYGSELLAKIRKLAQLVKHIVHLVGSIDGRGGYLTGVDDNLLGLDVSADQHSYERDYDKFRFHGFSCVSSLIAAIVPIFCCRSRNGFFFSLLDS